MIPESATSWSVWKGLAPSPNSKGNSSLCFFSMGVPEGYSSAAVLLQKEHCLAAFHIVEEIAGSEQS